MSDAFRAGCAELGITEEMLKESLERSKLNPTELLTITTTTSPRNFSVSYCNPAGETKWTHLFMVVKPANA